MADGLFIGDLDEVEFIEDIEKRFGVAFDERDYPTWRTLGDIHASLMARLGAIEAPGGKCASQMAFYRLRHAAGSDNAHVRPETQLDALGLGSPSKTLRQLARCGLDVPAAHGGWIAGLAAMAMLGAVFGIAIAALSGVAELGRWSALAIAATALLLWLAPARYPDGMTTLGDLARHVGRTNAMMLKAHGAGLRPGDIWESLRAMASDATGIASHAIRRETHFIRQKAEKKAA